MIGLLAQLARMKHGLMRVLLALALAVGAGCRKERALERALGMAETPPAPPPAETLLHLNHAQTNLPVIKVWLGPAELSTEVCLTPQQLATGMMFRTNMAENTGMLFPLAIPQRASFYMRNTRVPLSAAYIDSEGVIQEIHDLKPLDENPVPSRSEEILFVLEVNQGWFQRHQVSTGAVIRTALGSLKDAFRPRR